MKTINYYTTWFKGLNQDERETLAGAVIAVLFVFILIWLQSTNSYPVLDVKTRDHQTYEKKTYELKPSFNKYMNHVYNDKYSK